MVKKYLVPGPGSQEYAVGDLVHLRYIDGFDCLVTVIISSIDGNMVSGKIVWIFDWDTQAAIRDDDPLAGDIQTVITFAGDYIHKVVKPSPKK